jgi:hypothetical protein
VSFEWQLLNEDAPAEDPQPAVPAAGWGSSAGAIGLRGVAALVVVLVAGAALYLWRIGEVGARQLEAELDATVAAKAWLAGQPDATVQVQGITYEGDVAGVVVATTQIAADGQAATVRERLFFRPTATGWVRVAPQQTLLSVTTVCCTITYHRLDAAAVTAATAGLDALYAELRRDYALPPAAERITIALRAAPPYPMACYRGGQICVASPALTALPVEITEAEALQIWLVRALAYQVRREAMAIAPLWPAWHYAAGALTRLTLRRHSPRVAAWEADLTAWLYGSAAVADGQALAQTLQDLCAAHRPLAQLPQLDGATSIHLCTTPPDWVSPDPPPTHLYEPILGDKELAVAQVSWQGAVGFQTVLDYTIATYGRQVLPELVAGFRRYDTWAELIPAVFGVSAAKFEAGWQRYLAAQYGATIAVEPGACPLATRCAQAAAPHTLDAVTP